MTSDRTMQHYTIPFKVLGYELVIIYPPYNPGDRDGTTTAWITFPADDEPTTTSRKKASNDE